MNENRALGEVIPISVSTAIPFEGLPAYSSVKEYKAVYLSIETLTRNAISCLEDKNPTVEKVRDAVIDDIQGIAYFIKLNLPYLNIFLYTTTRRSLKKEFPKSTLNVPITEKQRTAFALIQTVEALIRKEFYNIIIDYDTIIKPERGFVDAFVLTSFPTELLGDKQFGNFALLESYTGKVKTRSEFNTKLTEGNKHLFLPFLRFTLSVFGDNNKLLKAMNKATRERVLEIAIQGRWTVATKKDLIKSHIEGYYNLDNKQDLLSLL